MATQCWSTVRGCRMRATLVDECGKPVEGPCSQVVTDGFVTVNYAAEIEEGDELLVKNACGDICVVDRGCPELKYYNVEIEFCKVDPDLFTMLTGQPTVFDFNGDAVGIRVGQRINCRQGFGLEVWTTIPQQKCAPGQTTQTYGYFLVPWLTNGIMGDFTIENDVITFSVTAQSRDSHQWNKGPYNVVAQDSALTAGRLLEKLEQTEHLHMQLTRIQPPETACGCQPLEYCEEPTVVIEVTNDADLDGTFTDNESASAPGQSFPVRVVVTNTGAVNGVVQTLSLTDENGLAYDLLTGAGTLPASGACAVPAELAPGEQFTCTVNLLNYSPIDDVEITMTGAVVLANVDDEFCVDRDSDQTTFRTDASQPPIDQLTLTAFTESGANGSASGPGGQAAAGNLVVQCAAPDELQNVAQVSFDVNNLESITVNSLTLTDDLGRVWDVLTGVGSGAAEGDLTGVGCAGQTTHLPNTVCGSDDLFVPLATRDAWQASIEGGVPVVLTLTMNATSDDSGTNQVTVRALTLSCA